VTDGQPIKGEAAIEISRGGPKVQDGSKAQTVLPPRPAESDKAHLSTGHGWSNALGLLGFRSPAMGANDCLTAAQMEELRRQTCGKDVTDAVAEELSATLGLAQSIRSRDIYIEGAYGRLKFILDCLLFAKPQLILCASDRSLCQVRDNQSGTCLHQRWKSNRTGSGGVSGVPDPLVMRGTCRPGARGHRQQDCQ
jgi:hypothetical protein